MWPDDPFEGLWDYAKRKAKEYVKATVTNYVKGLFETAKSTVKNLDVQPYAKAEGKVTLGPRVAANLKKNTGIDVNLGSKVVASGTAEASFSGVKFDKYLPGKSTEGKSTSGVSIGAPVGVIEGIPVSFAGSKSTEKTFIGQRNESTTVTGSMSAAVTGTPFGIFGTLESVNTGGDVASTMRIAPFNYGVSFGAVLVGEFNFDFGIKIKFKSDE